MTSLLAVHWIERKFFSLKSVLTKICLNLDVVIDPKDWVNIKKCKGMDFCTFQDVIYF